MGRKTKGTAKNKLLLTRTKVKALNLEEARGGDGASALKVCYPIVADSLSGKTVSRRAPSASIIGSTSGQGGSGGGFGIS